MSNNKFNAKLGLTVGANATSVVDETGNITAGTITSSGDILVQYSGTTNVSLAKTSSGGNIDVRGSTGTAVVSLDGRDGSADRFVIDHASASSAQLKYGGVSNISLSSSIAGGVAVVKNSAGSAVVTINGDSASAAMTITQVGSGNAIVVEDASSPDSTPFCVTADGNVGVGTLTPTNNGIDAKAISLSAPLYPRIDLTGTTNSHTGFASVNDSTGYFNIGTTSSTPIAIYTNNTEKVRITTGGDVAQVSGTKHYFDGVAATGNTYITESSADVMDLYAGGNKTLSLSSTTAAVVGILSTSGTIAVTRTSLGDTALSMQRTGSLRFDFNTGIAAVTGDALEIKDSSANSYLTFRGGKVGVANTNPSATLDITGSLTASGNVTLGDAATDTVTVNGYMGVGGAGASSAAIKVTSTSLAGTAQYAQFLNVSNSAAGTAQLNSIYSGPIAANNVTDVRHLYIDNATGAGSVTTQYGVDILDLTKGGTNIAFRSAVSSGANKWNIYASGTANSAFAGNVRIGSTTAPSNALDVTGAMTVSGNVTLGDASTDTVTVNGYMGVGGAPNSVIGLRVGYTFSSGTSLYGVVGAPTGPAAATSFLIGVSGAPATAAAVFTANNTISIYAPDHTKGAGSTITNQHGLYVADQTQGTNNYGITSLVSSGSNKWNIYASGTAANYFAGNVGIGTASFSDKLHVEGSFKATGNVTLGDASTDTVTVNGYMGVGGAGDDRAAIKSVRGTTGGVSQFGVWETSTAGSDATTSFQSFYATPSSSASAYTLADMAGFRVDNGTKGASSTITNFHGVRVSDLTNGTNNYGITSAVSSGSNKWNIYASGTASNYFAGNVGVGTSSPAAPLHASRSYTVPSGTGISASTVGIFSYNNTANASATVTILSRSSGSSVLNFGNEVSENVCNILLSGANPYMALGVAANNTSAATERMRIDNSGNVLIGSTAARANFSNSTVSSRLQVEGTSASTSSFAGVQNSNDAGEAFLFFAKSRGTTVGSNTIVQSGDRLGNINFQGSDGTEFVTAAAIFAAVDGTPGANDMPGRLVFQTTADTAASPTERMRIHSSGGVSIGNTTDPGAANLSVSGSVTAADAIGTVYSSVTPINTDCLLVLANLQGAEDANDHSSIQFNVYGGTYNRVGTISAVAESASNRRLALAFCTDNGTTRPEAMRIDSSGNVGIGVTPSAWGASQRALQIGYSGALKSSVAATSVVSLLGNTYYDTTWRFQLTDSTYATRYDQSGGTGAHSWHVSTTAGGTAGNAITFTQVLAVEKDKSLALQGATSAAGCGIAFPATQVASSDANTLDDYEEGTFTPTIVGTSTAGTATYAYQVGRYTKIGNRVLFNIDIEWTGHTGTGNLQISGLPFTSNSTSRNRHSFSVGADSLTYTAGAYLTGFLSTGATSFTLLETTNGGAFASVAIDAAANLYISGHYEI